MNLGINADQGSLLLALDDAAGWRERLRLHRDRRHTLGYDVSTADALAAGEILNEMHFALTAAQPSDPTVCAGCGELLKGDGLDLGDGARVHHGDRHACLRRYGEKWRKQAADGLKALGVPVPAHLGTLQ